MKKNIFIVIYIKIADGNYRRDEITRLKASIKYICIEYSCLIFCQHDTGMQINLHNSSYKIGEILSILNCIMCTISPIRHKRANLTDVKLHCSGFVIIN